MAVATLDLPESSLTDEQRVMAAMVEVARTDPLVYANLTIAADNLQVHHHAMHLLMQDFISACVDSHKHCLIQAPPEHGKSVQVTSRMVHMLGQDQSLKIGLVSHKDLVEEHLMTIRKQLVSSTCARVFPHIRPDYKRSSADRGEWSKSKLYLIGESKPAVEAFLLFGSAEGHRLDIMWIDDAVGRKCLFSEAERNAVAAAISDTFSNRLTEHGILIVTNNSWHPDDPIHEMKESSSYATLWIHYEDVQRIHWEIYHPPDSWPYETSGTFPLWEQWPRKRLLEKRAEPGNSYVRLWEGRPVAGTTRFPHHADWKRYTREEFEILRRTKGCIFIAALDPAGGKNAKKNDFAAIVVLAVFPDQTKFVWDVWTARRPAEIQIEQMYAMHRELMDLGFGGLAGFTVEAQANVQGFVKAAVKAHQDKLRRRNAPHWQLPVTYKHASENKESRIERLAGPLLEGYLKYPDDLEERMKQSGQSGTSWRYHVTQVEEWPQNPHDDAPDVLSGACDAALIKSPPVQKTNTFQKAGLPI